MTRKDVLSRAADECLKEFYSWAVPNITWDKFIIENKVYNKKYKEWEKLENKPPILEYCGPRPYEFYYLPKDIFDDIKEEYVNAYKLNSQEELLNIIKILKDYCKEPIIDKYIEGENGFPGYRGYEHPNNLEKELIEICDQHSHEPVNMAKEIQNKFFEFLDMAGNFYNWNGELNSFYMTVCLGASPNSNKQAVIDNWKKYRNKDIEINEEQIKKDYYGEELD